MRKIMILFSMLLMAAAGPMFAGTPEETSGAPQAKATSGCPHAAQAAKAGCQKAARPCCRKGAAKDGSGCCHKDGKAAAGKGCCKKGDASAKKGCCKKAAGARCSGKQAGAKKNCPKADAPEAPQNPAKN